MNSNGVSVVSSGEGKRFWLISDLVTPLVGGDRTGGAYETVEATSVINAGPPPHVHSREDEMFYVIDGQYTFIFGNQVLNAGPGTCVFLPRGIVHTFAKTREKPGKMLVTLTPSGFGKAAYAASQPCTDPTCPPPMSPAAIEKMTAICTAHGIEFKPEWKADQPMPPRNKPRELWVIGQHIRPLLGSDQTNGQFSVCEITSLTDDAVPVHIHRTQDEMFYVLEGTYEFNLHDRKLNATPGTFIHVPKQTPHGFRKAGTGPAKMVDFHTPGGFERFFEATGTVCTDIHTGPPRETPDFVRFEQICREHGMELVR